MNWIDYAFIAIVFLCAVHGFLRGMVRQAFGVASIFLGVYLAGRWSQLVSDSLFSSIDDRALRNFLAYVVTFCIIAAVVIVVGRLVHKEVIKAGFSKLNRLGGAILGAFKGFVIVLVLVSAIFVLVGSRGPYVRDSFLIPYLLDSVSLASSLLPDQYRAKLKGGISELRKYLDMAKKLERG